MIDYLIFGISLEILIISFIWANRSLKSSTRLIDWEITRGGENEER